MMGMVILRAEVMGGPDTAVAVGTVFVAVSPSIWQATMKSRRMIMLNFFIVGELWGRVAWEANYEIGD